MGFWEHVEELRRRVIVMITCVFVAMLFNFTFTLTSIEVNGLTIYIPYPNPMNNIASMFMKKLREDLIPSYVKLIVTGPAQAFLSQIYISLFLGVIISMPIIAYEISAFINPALYKHEKKMIIRIVIPSVVLFITGCIFSYYYVIPTALNFLYAYSLAIGAELITITIDSFIYTVVLFMIALGLAFQLPMVMWFLTRLELVKPDFWRENFKLAFLAIVVFSAIITPDGSGVTMWLIGLPMILLYCIGYFVSKSGSKENRKSI